MKFKENAIKPGMVIHCPEEKDAEMLLEYLEEIGYYWTTGAKPTEHIFNAGYYRISRFENKIWLECGTIDDEIIEFSDLIKLEPRFKVGDKVKVRSDLKVGEEYGRLTCKRGMQIYAGKIKTIIWVSEAGDKYRLDDNPLDDFWTDEMLEPVDDSPMMAEEVLEWLKKYRGKMEFKECFGRLYAMDILFNLFTAEEILDKITAYEAAKKAPKPVEVKWVDVCRIIQIQDNGVKKCVYEEDMSNTPSERDLKGICEDILKKYISERDGKYIAVIEDICRVKEGES